MAIPQTPNTGSGAEKKKWKLRPQTQIGWGGAALALTLALSSIQDIKKGSSDPVAVAYKDAHTNIDQLQGSSNVFSNLPEADQKKVVDLCKKLSVPEHFLSQKNGITTITNENMNKLINDYLIPQYKDEKDHAKKALRWDLIGLCLIAGAVVYLRMKYNKQDQMLSRLAQADIIERWKHTLHTLPSNLDQMTSLFAAAGLGDSTEQKLNLENERDQKLQDIEDGLQKAQAILDLLPGLQEPDLKKLSTNIDELTVASGDVSIFIDIVKAQKTLDDTLIRVGVYESTIQKLQAEVNGVVVNSQNMDDIMNKNGIISDSQQKLNQENINLNKNEEVLRKLLEKFYADQKNIQDTAIQNLNIQKVAIPGEYTKKIQDIGDAESILKNREQNKTSIVESIFPDTMQVETEQLQEKIQAKMGVIADLKTKLKASIEIAGSMNDQKKEIGEKVALLKKNHKIKKKDIEELSNNKLQLAALLGAEFDGKTLSEILTPFDPQHPAGTAGTYSLKDQKYLSVAGFAAAFKNLNILAARIHVVDMVVTLEGRLNNKTSQNADSPLQQQLDKELKELRILAAEQNEINEMKGIMQAMKRAFTVTIDELSKTPRSLTVEQVENIFIKNIQKHAPSASPLEPDGIKGMNNTVNKMDTNILRKSFTSLLGGTAIGVGSYHVLRGLFNLLPANFPGNKAVDYLTRGDTLLDVKNIPLVAISAAIGWMAHRYMHHYNSNMNNYKANNLSGTPGFREIFSRHVAVPMMFCVGAYGFLQSLDVAGSTATGAGGARKNEQKKFVKEAHNQFANNEALLHNYLAGESEITYNNAVQTITKEASTGVGPFTAQKIVRAFVPGGNTYNSLLSGQSQLPNFQEGYDKVPEKERGELELLEKDFQGALTYAQSQKFIMYKGKRYKWEEIPILVNNIGTGIFDINTTKQTEEIKRLHAESVKEYIDRVKTAIKKRAETLGTFSQKYNAIGGLAITFTPMDSIKISDNFTKLEQSIGKINKVYKDNSSYFNVFSISGIKDMFKTIGNLPPKNAIPIILWISIMSIFPIWLALYKFAGTRRTMRGKDKHDDEVYALAASARKDLVETLEMMLKAIPAGDPQREIMAKIVEHVKAENTEGIASAVLQVQHRPMRDVSTLERKAKKKAKAQNAQNRAYNARDLATRLQDIKDIVAANKEDIDQEAGTFVNTATGKHELYTSWVLRCKGFTPDQFAVVISDMLINSPTFQTEILSKLCDYNTQNIVNSQTTNAITALDASLQQSVTATLEENKKPKRYTKIFNGMKSSITNRRGDKKTDEDNGSI